MNRFRSAFMADASAGEACMGVGFTGLKRSRDLFLLQEERGIKLCLQLVLLLFLNTNAIKSQDCAGCMLQLVIKDVC